MVYLSITVAEGEAGVATAWVEEMGMDTAWVVDVAVVITAWLGGGAMVDTAWEEITGKGADTVDVLVEGFDVVESEWEVLVDKVRLVTAWEVVGLDRFEEL